MYQGNIGQLVNMETGEKGWYQKMHCGEDTVYINVKDCNDKIDVKLVAEEMKGYRVNKTHQLTVILDADETIRHSHFEIDESSIDKAIAQKQAKAMMSEMSLLQEQARVANSYISDYVRIRDDLAEKMCEMGKQLAEILEGKPMKYTYVYGKHTADSREYCWELPHGWTVNTGDTVVCDTSF